MAGSFKFTQILISYYSQTFAVFVSAVLNSLHSSIPNTSLVNKNAPFWSKNLTITMMITRGLPLLYDSA